MEKERNMKAFKSVSSAIVLLAGMALSGCGGDKPADRAGAEADTENTAEDHSDHGHAHESSDSLADGEEQGTPGPGAMQTPEAVLGMFTMPAYISVALSHATEFDFSEEQHGKLLALKERYQPQALPVIQDIAGLAGAIRSKSLDGHEAAELNGLSTEFGALRMRLAEVMTSCRDDLLGVVTEQQWEAIVRKYDETNPYDMRDPMGRMSPAPNYMIDVFHVESITLSQKQKEGLASWSTDRHANSVMAHGEIAALEQRVRAMSLEKGSKEDILKVMQEMEDIRHRITLTKSDCRDYMRGVLNEEEWDALVAFVRTQS